MAKRKQLLSDEEIKAIRLKTIKAIEPLRPPVKGRQYAFQGYRTVAGKDLPPYYLVYFLLVDLLRFPAGGREEKVAWTISLDLDGRFARIEYRKMGLGIISSKLPEDEEAARRIVELVKRGISKAAPYFEHLAAQAIQRSDLNITNNSRSLFDRYQYLRSLQSDKSAEADARKDEHISKRKGRAVHITFPAVQLRREAGWLAISAIEAFFSWTEHVLIHIAVLRGVLTTGEQVADLAAAEWSEKFKKVFDMTNADAQKHYNSMRTIRQEIRNFIAHGAFGKNGETFQFHSAAGAVPVLLLEGSQRFSLFDDRAAFNESDALKTLDDFLDYLWSGDNAPAKLHIQDYELTSVLPFASDGSYTGAMQSIESMEEFSGHISRMIDDSANMDW
jgi:hypothetical protein